MKYILIAIFSTFLLGCTQEKSVLLPEIENASVTKILDISPAYLFYDETKPDSLELNRANLIVTTNWLVNVDKRLTLKQVIPAIKKLQDKKLNSGHKKEGVRNYYTCNDKSIKNLGFLDFTDVVYKNYLDEPKIEDENTCSITIISFERIIIYALNEESYEVNFSNFENKLNELLINNRDLSQIKLSFNEALTFQDYISIKSKLSSIKMENTAINNKEFIFN